MHLPPPVHGSSMVGKWIKESVLINRKFDCDYLNLLASKDVGQSGEISFGKLYTLLITFFKLFKMLFSKRYDLCYFALTTTGIGFYRDVLLVLLLKMFRVEIIFHLHNKGVAKAATNSLHKVLYRFVFKNTKSIILSEYLYYDIEKFVPKKDVYICPNGIPSILDNFGIHTFNDGRAKDEIKTILFLSNMIESKGVYILLEALKHLKEQSILFKAVFVGGEGDINTSSFNSRISELGLLGEVEYLGKKYGKEKATIFTDADIFVFPTFYEKECFPLVLLEAMQYSLPIVTTAEGGIKSIVKDHENGYLVEQKSSVQLSEKIANLISNPHTIQIMGSKGRAKFLEEFTLDCFENRLFQILTSNL